MNLRCSLVISTYNWDSALELCLLSVHKQTLLPDEIIIADDGSNEKTKGVIDHFSTLFTVPVHHVWHTDKGFRKALILNKAVHESSFDYIIQIDGDVVLNKHFIADHIAIKEQEAFVRGTRAMLTAEKTKDVIDNRNINISAFSDGVQHRLNGMRCPVLSNLFIYKKRSSKSVRGSNLAFWKTDFIAVNGYNNLLEGWGHEDEELALRFINAGLIKKSVKLVAVQFHLYHSGTHRNAAQTHRNLIDRIELNKIKTSENGYGQVHDDE